MLPQLYFEDPPQSRRQLRPAGAAKDQWRGGGGQKGAHFYPSKEEGPRVCRGAHGIQSAFTHASYNALESPYLRDPAD